MDNSTVSSAISNKKIQTDLQQELEIDEFTILAYGGRGMERSECEPEAKKKELSKQVELSWGFGELRGAERF